MAAELNLTRIRDSKIIAIVSIILIFASKQIYPPDNAVHLVLDYVGYFLISFCALGRVYATAFLGGHKNAELVTYGPFSVVRNPLYFFSLLGVFGIALVTMHAPVMIFVPLAFTVLYYFLILREEKFLSGKFGQAYADYKKRVPRLIPNPRLYHAPETVAMVPKYLNNALFDAIWWFVPFPVLEILEHFKP